MVTPSRLRPAQALQSPQGSTIRRSPRCSSSEPWPILTARSSVVRARRPWTAGRLWAATTAVALAIRGDIAPGAVVATATDTGPEAIVATAALSALGAVELPLAPDIPADWASRLLSTTRAVAVLTMSTRRTPALEQVASAAGLSAITIEDHLAPLAGKPDLHPAGCPAAVRFKRRRPPHCRDRR